MGFDQNGNMIAILYARVPYIVAGLKGSESVSHLDAISAGHPHAVLYPLIYPYELTFTISTEALPSTLKIPQYQIIERKSYSQGQTQSW